MQDAVLVIDPCTGELDTSTYTGLEVGGAKWHGAAISDGLIYCVPFNGASAHIDYLPIKSPDNARAQQLLQPRPCS